MRLLLVAIGSLPCVLGGVLWKSNNNCKKDKTGEAVQGIVVDAVCANNQFGDVCENHNEVDCKSTVNHNNHRCSWDNGKCKFNRDEVNNVCFLPNPKYDKNGALVLPEATQACKDILTGKCPLSMQIPKGCCTDEKYDNLLVSQEGFVCCNTPCGSLEASAANQTMTTDGNPRLCHVESMAPNGKCGPGARSAYGFGYGGMGSIMNPMQQMNAFGMFSGAPMSAGVVNPSYGHLPAGLAGLMGPFGSLEQAAATLEEAPVGASKNHHVDEITVDDFFECLIGALDSDKDVFESDTEMISDPWFGKQMFGGGNAGVNMIDPWLFINQIYGSPYGMGGMNTRFGFGASPYGAFGPLPNAHGSPYGPYGASPYSSPYGSYGSSPYGAPPSPYGSQGPAPYGQAPPPYGQAPSYGQTPAATYPPAPSPPAYQGGAQQQPAYPPAGQPQQPYPQPEPEPYPPKQAGNWAKMPWAAGQ